MEVLENHDYRGGSSLNLFLTFATVGEGNITVRDFAEFDLSALNRDANNVQRVTNRQYIDLGHCQRKQA